MSLRRVWVCVVTAAMPAVAACDQPWEEMTSLEGERFEATLSGASEVPAVTTTATGAAVFAVVQDTFLIYRVDVVGIDSATLAHIHDGAAGAPGPVIVDLYLGPTRSLAYSGPLGFSQLRVSQLTKLPTSFGATSLDRFNELLARMRAGTVYVNVHSRKNPGGEIRGQIGPQ